MKMRSNFWVFALAVLIFTASAHASRYVIVAQFAGQDTSGIEAAIRAAGGRLTASVPEIGVLAADSSAAGFADAILKRSDVQGVTEDVPVAWIGKVPSFQATDIGPAGVNSEPGTARQWNLRQIGADKTAAAGIRGNNVARARVAVLDAGIVCDHEDIAANLNLSLSGSFVPGEGVCVTAPGFNHGTHVAGIIAAPINGIGVQGVAPEAEIVAVKVLSENTGSGDFVWLIRAIIYASGPAVHADVINMSLGATFDRINAGGGGLGLLIAALNRAVDYATAHGTLVVSSAGNEGVDLNSRIWAIPAQSGNGMGISATGPIAQANFDRLASYSNYGQSVVSVAAPGGDFTLVPALTPIPWYWDMVLSPGGLTKSRKAAYYYAAGTSMAAPHVSGVAALIVGKYGHMPASQLATIIQQSAADILKPGADAETGKGRIDAWKAVQ
jgi:subtilisin family serine protease